MRVLCSYPGPVRHSIYRLLVKTLTSCVPLRNCRSCKSQMFLAYFNRFGRTNRTFFSHALLHTCLLRSNMCLHNFLMRHDREAVINYAHDLQFTFSKLLCDKQNKNLLFKITFICLQKISKRYDNLHVFK